MLQADGIREGTKERCGVKDEIEEAQSDTYSKDSLPRAMIPVGYVEGQAMAIGEDTEGVEDGTKSDRHPDKGLTPGCSTDGSGLWRKE